MVIAALLWTPPAFSQGVTLIAGANSVARSQWATNALIVAPSNGAKVYTISGYNSSTATQYIYILNTNAVPANGTVPRDVPPIKVPASSNFSYDVAAGRVMNRGVAVLNSTSELTLTNGSANCWFEVIYYDRAF